jgi:hypothetical protein
MESALSIRCLSGQLFRFLIHGLDANESLWGFVFLNLIDKDSLYRFKLLFKKLKCQHN